MTAVLHSSSHVFVHFSQLGFGSVSARLLFVSDFLYEGLIFSHLKAECIFKMRLVISDTHFHVLVKAITRSGKGYVVSGKNGDFHI